MNWQLHVARLAVLGRLPFGTSLRRWKRRRFGYPPDPGNIRNTLQNFAEMSAAIEAQGRTFKSATILEIGSGWFPTIPLMLHLQGAKRVVMTDLNPHLDEVTLASTIAMLKQLKVIPGELESKSLQELDLEYLAPFNPSLVQDRSLDFVISRTVLEHISEEGIVGLLRTLKPKLAPDGLMVHCVDYSDHLEHRDKSISKINFLTWSDKKHRVVNYLTQEGENRLRHHEYRELFSCAGYRIVSESSFIHPQTAAIAKTLPLRGRFSGMTADELSVLSGCFVLAST